MGCTVIYTVVVGAVVACVVACALPQCPVPPVGTPGVDVGPDDCSERSGGLITQPTVFEYND